MNDSLHKTTTTHWFPWDYFIVTFGLTWLCWLPGVLETQGLLTLPLPWEAFFLFGIFGPLVGATWANVRRRGWAAAGKLVARVADVRIGAQWWLVILVIPLVISALAYLGVGLFEGKAATLMASVNLWMIVPTIFLMTLIGGGQEEFGWRGYALDILQERWGAWRASIVLGCIWGIWHFPLFFVQHTGQYYTPMWAFMLASPALSIVTTWIYNGTGKKLFAAWLLHGVINAGMDVFPPIQKAAGADQRTFLLICGLYWVLALLVMVLSGNRRPSKVKAP